MDAARTKVSNYLKNKFEQRPYFAIEHYLRDYGEGPILTGTITEWRVYAEGYNWHRAPTIEEAIAMLDKEIFPPMPGCIGVGV
jgi:hypothetical protein